MPVNLQAYQQLTGSFKEKGVRLIAVSKIRPPQDILKLYKEGHRDFAENYVQELLHKHPQLPENIQWHFIGHLQTNKVKQIAPVVYLVHSVDSERLLKEISKQGEKIGRQIQVLLQVHIASEDTKFGLDENELAVIIEAYKKGSYPFAKICGLMGMASFSDDGEQVRSEFRVLKKLFDRYTGIPEFNILSMGMSGDYELAIEEGSNMVRIGSLLFGYR